MAPCVLVIMGVSGSGKTTMATLLSEHLHWELADEDRWPWLQAIAAWIDTVRGAGGHGVIGCSALKRSYRDVLIGTREDVGPVYLEGDMDRRFDRRRPARDRGGNHRPAAAAGARRVSSHAPVSLTANLKETL